MDDILDDIYAEELPEIDDNQLFLNIWFQPYQTMRYILAKKHNKYLAWFLILGGMANAFDPSDGLGYGGSLFSNIIQDLVTGVLFGWVGFYLIAWLMSYTGKWLGGQAKSSTMLIITSWSVLPPIVSFGIFLVAYVILGYDAAFQVTGDYSFSLLFLIQIFLLVIDLVALVWSMVIMVNGIRIAQNFSTGRAILNMLLPAVIIVFIAMILVGLWI